MEFIKMLRNGHIYYSEWYTLPTTQTHIAHRLSMTQKAHSSILHIITSQALEKFLCAYRIYWECTRNGFVFYQMLAFKKVTSNKNFIAFDLNICLFALALCIYWKSDSFANSRQTNSSSILHWILLFYR